MKLKTIIAYLEEIAPLNYQESYDNCGLLVGNSEMEISAAIITLDCTEAIINEAIEKGANLVVAHHPIIFSGLKKINGNTYIERVIIKAIQNNIAIYAIHTNLDHIKIGVNAKIGAKLRLQNLAFLLPKISNPSIGSGMVGTLLNETDEMTFVDQVKQQFELPMLKHTCFLNKKVSKVAFCGGSGSFLLSEAIAHQADVFISSDFKYHQYFDAENKILIIDIGHYEAEICTKELIFEILTEKFPTFTLHFSEVNTNPVKYL